MVFLVLGCGAASYHRERNTKFKMRSDHEALREHSNLLERENAYLSQAKLSPDQIEFGIKIAKGAEGEVWKGRLLGHSYKELVAIKRALPLLEDKAGEASAVFDEREVSFLLKMKHDRIVIFIGAGEMFVPEWDCTTLFIVQEFMSGGSIDGALWHPNPTQRDSLSWKERVQWASDIAEAMAFIHAQGYTHRDLKSKNVLYDRASMRAKVADFGTSVSMEDNEDFRSSPSSSDMNTALLADVAVAPVAQKFMTAQCGTPEWMAPELAKVALQAQRKADAVLTHEPCTPAQTRARKSYWQFQADHARVEYTQQVDVYAFAITMFEICSHSPPWDGVAAQYEVFAMVMAHMRPAVGRDIENEAPDGWMELMHACWNREPTSRPSFSQICGRLAKMSEHLEDTKNIESYDLQVLSPRSSSCGTSTGHQSLPIPQLSVEEPGHRARFNTVSPGPFQQHRVGSLEEGAL